MSGSRIELELIVRDNVTDAALGVGEDTIGELRGQETLLSTGGTGLMKSALLKSGQQRGKIRRDDIPC